MEFLPDCDSPKEREMRGILFSFSLTNSSVKLVSISQGAVKKLVVLFPLQCYSVCAGLLFLVALPG